MKIELITPKASAIEELGRRLAHVRKQQGLSQAQLAKEAGLGIATLRRIERGEDAQLGSWFKILRVLDRVSAFDALVPETFNSPLAEVKSPRRRRQKTVATERTAVWGDELE